MSLLHIENLTAGYGKQEVLRDVSLHVDPGEIVAVIGPNGAGKSTILRSIFGLTRVSSGEIRFQERSLLGLRPHQVAGAGLAFVTQGRNIFPSLSVRENLELGLYGQPVDNMEAHLARVYDQFPRLRERQRQKAGTLSGGEQQMLALGRALMTEPALLLLDEPSLGLAPLLVEYLFEEIQRINAAGVTVLMVEQNARRALAAADRGYVLELGCNRFEGTGQALLEDEKVRRLYLGGATEL